MKLKQIVMLALIAGATAFAGISTAEAARAVITRNTPVRTGPGTQHRVIGHLRSGDRVTVNRCASSRTWCQVRSRHTRDGWVNSRSLGRVPGTPVRRSGICFYGDRGHVCLGR